MIARVFTWSSFAALSAAVALLDRITQGELAFTMLFVLLVLMFAWVEGTVAGCLLSLAASAYWTYSDVHFGRLSGGHLIPLVNAGLRFCVLAFLGYVIAQLRLHLEQSVALRVKDHTTGLLNDIGLRERLVAELSRAARRERPVSAAVVKVCGAVHAAHAVGDDETDAVIKPIADELLRQVRRCDIVARLDGDDMVAILPETDAIGTDVFSRRASARLALAAERAGCSVEIATFTCAKPTCDADVFLKIIESRRASDSHGHIDT